MFRSFYRAVLWLLCGSSFLLSSTALYFPFPSTTLSSCFFTLESPLVLSGTASLHLQHWEDEVGQLWDQNRECFPSSSQPLLFFSLSCVAVSERGTSLCDNVPEAAPL